MAIRGPGGPSRRSFRSEKICKSSGGIAEFSRGDVFFVFLRPPPDPFRFFLFAEGSSVGFSAVFGLGMEIFFRVEESHHRAVEGSPVIGAEAVAA